MPSSRVTEVLYDSETVLRLVDREIEELCEAQPEGNHLAVLLAVMQRANMEIEQVLRTLRESREVLQDVTLREIHDSTAKLAEVSSATELAATRIMDGLDRAQGLIDHLDEIDGCAAGGDATVKAAAVRSRLRDELFAIMGSLQFQDITSQQLGHVSRMLADVERRLYATTAILDGGVANAALINAESVPIFAESASTRNAGQRQAAAGVVVWGWAAKKAAH
ncbi:MAG: hypothetical protein ACR2MQ_00340 [Gemmatimonadaceae bacterium]